MGSRIGLVDMAASDLGREGKRPLKEEFYCDAGAPSTQRLGFPSSVSALPRAATLPILDVAEHRASSEK